MEKINNIKIISFRIYGSNDYFSDPENRDQVKCLDTIGLPDFPKKNWRTSCNFGVVPDEIIRYKQSFDGLNSWAIKKMFNLLDSSKTKEEQLSDCISELASRSTIFNDYRHYTTISIQREIDFKRYGLIKTEDNLNVQA